MPREISGFSNPLVKQVRSLRDKKHRRAEGLFLAEGLRILTEALDAGVVPQMLWHAPESGKHPLAGGAADFERSNAGGTHRLSWLRK